MKILFIGDIVGKSGRKAVSENLEKIIKQHNIDFTIANAENAAHGKGLTTKIFNYLLSLNIDAITLGNHAYAKDDVFKIIDNPQLIRPDNMSPNDLGKSYQIFEVLNKKIMVANVCGEVFMNNIVENPFSASKKFKEVKADIKIIDFHGEATAEKLVYLHYFKKDFTAILGTHTHIQTADNEIYDGCAYISDVGMCGPINSIIGRDIDEVIDNLVYKKKTYYTMSNNPGLFSAVVIEIDEKTNRSISIERILIKP